MILANKATGGTSKQYVDTELDKKVDKEAGKGLSQANFTTAEKNKLSGIEAGAEVNVNPDWNASSGKAQIQNKPDLLQTTRTTPLTGLSEAPSRTNLQGTDTVLGAFTKIKKWFTDLKTVAFTGSYNDLTDKPNFSALEGVATETYVNTGLADKVDKITGKGLSTEDFTTTEKTKLAGAAPLDSPVFTGTPTAPTPLTADNSTKLATTAWVKAQGYGTGAGSGDMLKATYDTNNDGIVDVAASAPWSGITGKPSTFPPEAHTHPSTDIAGLATSATTDTTTTANITDSINKRFVTDAQRTVLTNTSGSNTGDETQSSIVTKLGYTPLNPANNLSEVTAATARTNLGLGNSATLNTGTTAGTVATGDHTHAVATQSVAGFLSAEDKTKLDSLSVGGGSVVSVIGTAPIVSSGGNTPAISITAATTLAAGSMSAADKTKLDGIATGANNYVHPNHTGEVTSTGDGATVITAGAVTNSKLANMPATTFKANVTGGSAAPTDATVAQVKTALAYVVGDISGAAPTASPTFTGTPAAPTATVDTNTTQIATTAYVIGQGYLKSATASSTYAPLASPSLTGTPVAPTAAVNTNTTQIATTAFVLAQAASATPLVSSGSGTVGTATRFAREDHVHPFPAVLPTTVATTTYTLASSDNGKILHFTHASGCTVTVPSSLTSSAYLVALVQKGAAQVTVVGATTPTPVTVNAYPSTALKTAGLNAAISIYYETTNTYNLVGQNGI